ncbi:hypothetical protein [Ammoniphilus resinae]|uniref:Uncharacterized protein n=1 Tax=Ammoniphilus resinae TaxID=861532 RepID=A0ABS4GL17_9BACL|nr:hypothetical protein [Ammoniphilus resinae]MBP1930965.1 hypothetical protein [Ammoniphilus resinae]
MQIKVTMDSGKDYIVVMPVDDFINRMKDTMGNILNEFVRVSEGLIINPSHVASIEVLAR